MICFILLHTCIFFCLFTIYFGVATWSFQSPRSPVLCIFYLYSFLLHVFSYNITPPQFRSSYLLVSTHFHPSMFSLPVLARFCLPGRNWAAEILSARAAEIPFSHSFSPMAKTIYRNCLVVHVYRALFYVLAVDGVLSSLCYKLSVSWPISWPRCTINGHRR